MLGAQGGLSHAARIDAGTAFLARIAGLGLLAIEHLLGVSARACNLARVQPAGIALVEQNEGAV